MEKVYVVTEDSFDGGFGHYESVNVFSTKEKARQWFDSLVSKFKDKNPNWADKGNEYYENEDEFEWSVEGFYSSDHYVVSLSEQVVY